MRNLIKILSIILCLNLWTGLAHAQNAEKTKSFILNRLLEMNGNESDKILFDFYLDYFISIDGNTNDNKEHATAVLVKDISSVKVENTAKGRAIVIKCKYNALYVINDKEVINFFKKVLEKNPNQIKKTGEFIIPINSNDNEASLVTAIKYLVRIKGGKITDNLFE
jgi:hypothetical protein